MRNANDVSSFGLRLNTKSGLLPTLTKHTLPRFSGRAGKTNSCGEISLSSQNWVFRPNIYAFYSAGKAKNTDRLLEMLPVVFRELSGTISRFSGVLVYILGQPISFLWRLRNKAVGQNWSQE